MVKSQFLFWGFLGLLTGCTLPFLSKNEGSDKRQPPQPAPIAQTINEPIASSNQVLANQFQVSNVQEIDEKTYRFSFKEDFVWDAALSVIMQHYNISLIDKSNGVLTTEWDSYYQGSQVFRNKITLRVRRISKEYCEVLIHNNVEKLSDDINQGVGSILPVWLPHDKGLKEIARIVQNMSLALKETKPLLSKTYGNTGKLEEAMQDKK